MHETFDQIMTTGFEGIKPHCDQERVVVVTGDLTLEAAREALTSDDTDKVKEWLASGALCKATPQQIALWEADPEFQCTFTIVQPFVLVAPLPPKLAN